MPREFKRSLPDLKKVITTDSCLATRFHLCSLLSTSASISNRASLMPGKEDDAYELCWLGAYKMFLDGGRRMGFKLGYSRGEVFNL